MFQNIFESLKGIGIYGIISILIFFTFFTGMLVWAFALKKNYLTNMESLPLESGEDPENPNDNLQS